MTSPSPVTRPVLRYFGGKWRLAHWIIEHFPEHECYVEPFGGAASVLLRKPRSRFEVYNDLDGSVVNFFRVLRTRPRELVRALKLTPYSRAEFEGSYQQTECPVEAARRYFVLAWQGYGGPRRERLTGWKIQRRAWHSGRADQLTEWGQAKNLAAAARRLMDVQIESSDALDVIRRFDTPNTLFYCDPPYPSNTRNEKWMKSAYNEEISGMYHNHLGNLLNSIKGMAIISTYPNEVYDEMFAGWMRVSKTAQTMNKTIGVEVIYVSPGAVERLDAEGGEDLVRDAVRPAVEASIPTMAKEAA